MLWLIAKYRFRRISLRLGYSIPINVFGPGLSLPHRGNIIINPNTRIGENCRIHVGVNIGAHKDLAPVIGDNVYIGPGVILFGDIKIGNNVTIGANATLSIGPNYAHNDWLEIAINNGLIGVIIYIAYFISLIRDYIKSRKRLKYYYSNSLLMSTLILLSASFFSMSYDSIGISQTLAIGFVLAATYSTQYNIKECHK